MSRASPAQPSQQCPLQPAATGFCRNRARWGLRGGTAFCWAAPDLGSGVWGLGIGLAGPPAHLGARERRSLCTRSSKLRAPMQCCFCLRPWDASAESQMVGWRGLPM